MLANLLVNLVDQLHHDIGAGLHRLVIGTFDVNLRLALFKAEVRALRWRWRWRHHHAVTRAAVFRTTVTWTPMAGRRWRRRIRLRAGTWRWWWWWWRCIDLLTGDRSTGWWWWRWLLGERRPCREKKRGAGDNQLFHEGHLWCVTTQNKRLHEAVGCSPPKINSKFLWMKNFSPSALMRMSLGWVGRRRCGCR